MPEEQNHNHPQQNFQSMALEVDAAIRDIAGRLGYPDARAAEVFEVCAAYCALRDFGFEEDEADNSVSKITAGGAGDLQLDAIAIIVNGQLIFPDEDDEGLEKLLTQEGCAHITFLLVQATRQSQQQMNLNTKISTFILGVQTFFTTSVAEADFVNPSVLEWLSLKENIFRILKDNDCAHKCECRLMLVWPRTLNWNNQHDAIVRSFKIFMEGVGGVDGFDGHFSQDKVGFELIDQPRFLEIYDKIFRSDKAVARELLLSFFHSYTMSQAPGVYFGYLPASVYLDLISRSSQAGGVERISINHSLFTDNVRAFLGENDQGPHDINTQIRQGLQDSASRSTFHLRSNGITIIAKSCEEDDDKLKISDFQIVNGCQTSYILFNELRGLGPQEQDEIQVPVKIIATDDNDLVDSIIIGVNRQKNISDLDLLSRHPYVIRLGRYFAIKRRENEHLRIWFERRRSEFSYVTRQVLRVISLQDLMYAYSAMFHSAPHLNYRPKELLELVHKGEIFDDQHLCDFYHVSAIATWRMRQVLKYNRVPASRYGARQQFLYALRLLAERAAGRREMPPQRSGNGPQKYVNAIGKQLADQKHALALGQLAYQIIDRLDDTRVRDQNGDVIRGNLSTKAGKAGFTEAVKKGVLKAHLNI